jgi:RNA polymerase sigma-70 factor, ECF subfamily
MEQAQLKLSETMSAGPVDEGSSSASDESLVAALRQGDKSAGEMLVRRHQEPLLRFLGRIGGSSHSAEELFQQTWLSVLEHIEQFRVGPDGGMAFKAWLYRIASNKANDQWRSRGRQRVAHEGLRLVSDDVSQDASHRMSGTEQEARVRRAIDQLPDAQKQIVMLRYYAGLKFVEIAQMLDCPLNTALGRMHKAMLKLKDMIGERAES